MSDKKKVIVDSVEAKSPQEIQDIYNEELIRKSAAPITTADLIKSVTGAVQAGKRVPRLAFNENPLQRDTYAGVFKFKSNLLPSAIIKKIRVQNLLIAAIVRTRGFQMSMFGHPKNNRFDIGVEIKIKKQFKNSIEPEELQHIKERMDQFIKLLMDCGKSEGLKEKEKMTFSEFLSLQTQNGVSFGWFGTELIWEDTNYRKLHRFRPVDAGTIHHAIKKGDAAEGTRQSSLRWLEEQQNIRIDKDVLQKGEYDYVQVIDGMPRQAFTSKELIMYNLYPSTDIEHNNYPVTPLDTVINAVTTHSSIEVYNKLYFQNGKSAKGMLVIKSDNIDENTIQDMKQQFQASINNVNNSFKIPIFGVSREDEVQWMSTMPNRKDGEFEYLFDQTTRNILAAFNMSPDELPGFAHLSRGTNQASLSECLDPDSVIFTDKGLKSIKDVIGKNKEANVMVWSGLKFEEAKAFYTGEKELRKTFLEGNMSINTSPDHYFQVIGADGEPVWVKQSEIKENDYILINKKPVDGKSILPSFKNKNISKEMMEVLGWAMGDGFFKESKERSGGFLNLFYHPEKEGWILDRHFNVLKEFGLNPIKKEKIRSQEEMENIKNRYGFNNVSDKITSIKVYNTEFINWMKDVGFKMSSEGKEIPEILHTIDQELKNHFLKGLFSADGHINKATGSSVYLTVSNYKLKNQVISLLNSIGIRVNNYNGSTKQIFKGVERETIPAENKISIKDKRLFFQKIGFLQNHKQPLEKDLRGFDPVSIPISTQVKYVKKIINSNISREIKKDLYSFAKQDSPRVMSLNRLIDLISKAGLQVPKWMEDYYPCKVTSTVNTGLKMQMVDLTVYSDSHCFVANGIVVHNSNNEFKLTAQRDSGIRPLILKFQDFINEKLFPLLDPELSQLCDIHFSGLDSETRQQESNLLQAEMPIHMTYDEVMDAVDKDAIGEEWGGRVPMSERFQMVIDKYSDVSDIVSKFYKTPSALVDPMLKYKRDQFWFQNLQLLAEMNPNAVKAFFAPKPHALDILKMNIADMLDDEEGLF
jgi:intein/homing endonuclease